MIIINLLGDGDIKVYKNFKSAASYQDCALFKYNKINNRKNYEFF